MQSLLIFDFERLIVKRIKLTAPMSGVALPIAEAPNRMFANKECGDGITIFPNNGLVVSPALAKVDFIFPTRHCLGLITGEGLEIVIHVGMNTGHLQGEGFTVLVKPGEVVQPGQRLLQFDRQVLVDKKVDPVSVVLFPNLKDTDMIQLEKSKIEIGGSFAVAGYKLS